ncbi:uncharacterized protein TNCV_491201 [Trichonephila clavipes]|nr:uncharacterized protein TNCV_491201 [Trichonephila clavipes]
MILRWFDIGTESSNTRTLTFKKSDRGLACHEFEPSTTKDPPCRAGMHIKSVEISNVLPLVWCGVVVRRGVCQLRCRPRHLTMVENYVVVAKSPHVAEQCDVNIQSIN